MRNPAVIPVTLNAHATGNTALHPTHSFNLHRLPWYFQALTIAYLDCILSTNHDTNRDMIDFHRLKLRA